jgi:hypothetical protein
MMLSGVQQNAVSIRLRQSREIPFAEPIMSPTSIVEKIVILSEWTCLGLSALPVAAWALDKRGLTTGKANTTNTASGVMTRT